MKCDKEIVSLMHKYLDEELTEQERIILNKHLNLCEACNKHMSELKKSIAFVQSSSHIEAPANLTELVMSQLPEQKRSVNWKRWMKRHPALVAASIFIFLMATSMFSVWIDGGNELTVSGEANLLIDKEKNLVVVPKGEVVNSDLVIKNGGLQVEGQVNGNVTVINGEKYMAQAGNVAGDIEEINKGLEWFWYNVKSFFSDVINVFEK